jgi:transcriptional regulator with XRE-family HTH domain
MERFMETKHEIINRLASNLRYLRINTKIEESMSGKIKYMSQKDLAEMLGIECEQQISKFELGTIQMSASQLYRISKVFEIPIDSMFEDLTKSDYSKTIKYNIYT